MVSVRSSARTVVCAVALWSLASLLQGCDDHSGGDVNCTSINATPAYTAAKHRFDVDAAAMHGQLATASYCGDASFKNNARLTKWSCGSPCANFSMKEVRVVESDKSDDAYAFIARVSDDFTWAGGDCILTFRGTTDFAGWIQDFESIVLEPLDEWGVNCSYPAGGTRCKVGRGFAHNYHDLRQHILGNLSDLGCSPSGPAITITGHSLGAAQATIAMFDLKGLGYNVLPTYNFGSPRVGDRTFHNAFNAMFPEGGQLLRVTKNRDPAPHVPTKASGFVHAPDEVYFTEDDAHFRIGDGSGEDPCCADQLVEHDGDITDMVTACAFNQEGCDHLRYMKRQMGHFMSTKACVAPGTAHTFLAMV